jgi:cell division protein ZapE
MTSHSPARPATLPELYQEECERLGYRSDAAQERTIALLEDLRQRLVAEKSNGLLTKLWSRRQGHELERGIYLWGGVGRGKTWLMDLFFQSLPFKEKQRSHFHRFMQDVHDELKRHKDRADPLELMAEKVAKRARVLCFDELFVSDIADAMLLGNLFRGLFDRGVTLVATSNVPPDGLYKDGLQRARFLPAIRLLKENTEVVHTDGGTDYRLRLLEQAATWFDDSAPDTRDRLLHLFQHVAGASGIADHTLTLNHRKVRAVRQAGDVIWFEFKELCDGPRGQADYIELAQCYHTVFLSKVPQLGGEHENQARRFVTMIDEFYDRSVKLIIAAATPVHDLYQGSRLTFEFERTKSRLIEMQSQEYLARPHKA